MPKGRTIDERMGYSLGHYKCPCGYEIMGNLALRMKLHNKKCDLGKTPLTVSTYLVEDGKKSTHQVVDAIRGAITNK
jgi:phage tail tape-measure protein